MSLCNHLKRLAVFGTLGFILATSVASAQQATPEVRSVRVLGGPTRFTAPVRDIPALTRSMSRPNIQRDLSTVLERAGMPILTAQVQNILSNGQVTETTLAPGTVIEWMALRRGGPNVVRNIRWDGAAPLEGFEFIIDDMNETYTFFVPEICGNVSLVRREPSREAARRAEIARAEAAKAAPTRRRPTRRQPTRRQPTRRRPTRQQPTRRRPTRRRLTRRRPTRRRPTRRPRMRAAEAARQAEEARLALERDLRVRPFIAGYFGKQQRQYDDTDPADVGRLVNPVPAFGDPLVGFKGGVNLRMSQHFTFAPSIGLALNLDESERTSFFGDAEIQYIFARGAYLGTGVSLWDFTHSDNFTLAWLGTAGVPLWRNDAAYRQLQLSLEWRQMFDRMSDPDVNYQFWGGLRFLFK